MERNTVFRGLALRPEFTSPYSGNIHENGHFFVRDWSFNPQNRGSYFHSPYRTEMLTSPNHCDLMGSVYFNTNMIPYSRHIQLLPKNNAIEFPSTHNSYSNTYSSVAPLSQIGIYNNPTESTFYPNYKHHPTSFSTVINDGIVKQPHAVQPNKDAETRTIHFWRPFLNEETSNSTSVESDKSNYDENQQNNDKAYSNDNYSENCNEIQMKNKCENLNNIYNISPNYSRQVKDTQILSAESYNKNKEDRILTMTKTIDLLRAARKECDSEEPVNLVVPNIRNSEEEDQKQDNYAEGFYSDCKICNYYECPQSNTKTSSLSSMLLNENNESLSSPASENVARKILRTPELPVNNNPWQRSMKEINMSPSNGNDNMNRSIEEEALDNNLHLTSDKNIYESMHYQPTKYTWSTKTIVPNEYRSPKNVGHDEQHHNNLKLSNVNGNEMNNIINNQFKNFSFNSNHTKHTSLEEKSRYNKHNEHENLIVRDPSSYNGHKTMDSYCSSVNFTKYKKNYCENKIEVPPNIRNNQIANWSGNTIRYDKQIGCSIQRSNDNPNINFEKGAISRPVEENPQNQILNKVPNKTFSENESSTRKIHRSFHAINIEKNTEKYRTIYSANACHKVNENPSLNAMMDNKLCKPKPIQPNSSYSSLLLTNQNYTRNGEQRNTDSERQHSKEILLKLNNALQHENKMYSSENISESENVVNKHMLNMKSSDFPLAQNKFMHMKTTSTDIGRLPESHKHMPVAEERNDRTSSSAPKSNSITMIHNTFLETPQISNTTLRMLPTNPVIDNEKIAACVENEATNNSNREQTSKDVAMILNSSKSYCVENEGTYETMVHKKNTNAISVTNPKENISLNNTSETIPNQMKSVTQINSPDKQDTNQVINSESSSLQCVYCDKIFSSTTLLKEHLKSHPANSPYLCPHCDLKFASKPRYMRHALEHTKEKPYCCEQCHKCFTTVTAFHRHLHAKRHSGSNLSTCKQCGLSFIDNIYMSLHFKTHTGEHPFQCDICGNIFACKNNLKNHIMTHTGEKPFQCVHCAKRFVTNFSLKVHIRTHTKDYPYSCKVCKKKFLCSSNMTSHVRTHTGEKRHQCYKCGKFFSSLSGIQGHQRTHTGECPYSCNICKRSFASRFSLRIHKRTHSGENPHRCSYCNKTFSNSSNMRRHLRIHTGERPYSCTYCTKSFCSSTYLKSHVRTHTGEKPYKCKYCGKEFSNTLCFKQHVTNHERKAANP